MHLVIIAEFLKTDATQQIVGAAKCIGQPFEQGDGYLFWRSQFQDLLSLYDLTDLVDENQEIQTERLADATNPEYKKWQKNGVTWRITLNQLGTI